MNKQISKKDIAIVGMAGKFPKSNNIDEMWENLLDGKVLSHFYSDSELEELGVSKELIENKDFVKMDTKIDKPGSFDYDFFGYTRSEAELMDPQIRIMHEVVWTALEDAGIERSKHKNIGIYLSAGDNMTWRAYSSVCDRKGVGEFTLSHISNKVFISSLIAYKLGFEGPALYIDSACSSSLSSIHVACRNLLLKECNIAIAGGVSLDSTKTTGYLYQEGGVASKDGLCRAFDINSSGTVGGEGAAVVVLKRLEDAINQGDHIYAVIKGTAANNDGSRKVGYTAPSVEGQYDCIKRAHAMANVAYDTISYIETHGTGTKLGDSIEVEALNIAFKRDKAHSCAIGSVKTNMGHLDAAAGATGLIKTALSLKNKVIPATLNFTEHNPDVNFNQGPFYVNAVLSPWENNKETPLRAGVSGLGVGGTNVHCVVEENIHAQVEHESRKFHFFPFSTKSEQVMDRFETDFVAFLKKKSATNLADLSYTLLSGRESFKYRKSVVAGELSELISNLSSPEFKMKVPKMVPLQKRKVVFMFPGQGSQYYKMAEGIYQEEPLFREIIDEGLALLKEQTKIDFSKFLGFDEENLSDTDLINQTEYAQPLLFLVEYGMAKLLMSWRIQPDLVMGHSLGEYTAACLSGAFTLEDGLRIVTRRGQLMSTVSGGAMMSVGIADKELNDLLPANIEIGAINSIDSCVLSGEKEALENFAIDLNQRGINTRMLKVSIASHSKMMDEIKEAFEMELGKLSHAPLQIPVVSNLNGEILENGNVIQAEYWIKHLRNSVKFSQGVETVLKQSECVFIEVGPGKSLSTFIRQHHLFNNKSALVVTNSHPKDKLDARYSITRALGELWEAGIQVDLTSYYKNYAGNKIPAPTYPFVRNALPVHIDTAILLGDRNVSAAVVEVKQDQQEQKAKPRDFINTKYTPPETDFEKKLTAIFESFFRIDKVGINDDFFDLGGDSLKAVSLIAIISETLNVDISLSDFFENETIKKMSETLELKAENSKEQGTENSIII